MGKEETKIKNIKTKQRTKKQSFIKKGKLEKKWKTSNQLGKQSSKKYVKMKKKKNFYRRSKKQNKNLNKNNHKEKEEKEEKTKILTKKQSKIC